GRTFLQARARPVEGGRRTDRSRNRKRGAPTGIARGAPGTRGVPCLGRARAPHAADVAHPDFAGDGEAAGKRLASGDRPNLALTSAGGAASNAGGRAGGRVVGRAAGGGAEQGPARPRGDGP